MRFGTYSGASDVVALESLVRRSTLLLQLGPAREGWIGAVHTYSLATLDGSPLPSWLQQAGPDVVFGKVPVGVEQIALRVTAVMKDGTTNVRDIVIQTRTGEIQPVRQAERRSDVIPLFSQQLTSLDALSHDEVEILGQALARGRR